MNVLNQAVEIQRLVDQTRLAIAQGTLPTTNTRPLKWRKVSDKPVIQTRNFGKFQKGRLYLLQGKEQPVVLLNLSVNGGNASVRYVDNPEPFIARSKHLTLIPGEYASFDFHDAPAPSTHVKKKSKPKVVSPSMDVVEVKSTTKRPLSEETVDNSAKRTKTQRDQSVLSNETPLSWQALHRLNMLPAHWTEDDLKTVKADEVNIVPLANTDPVYSSVLKLLQLQDGVQAISKVVHPLSFLLFQLKQNPTGNANLRSSYAFSNPAQDRTALAGRSEDMVQLYATPAQVPRTKTETVLYVSRHSTTTSLHLRCSERFCEFVVVMEKKEKK